MRIKIANIFLGSISMIVFCFLCRLMQNNVNSAGDDPVRSWEAGDLNGAIFLFAIPVLLFGLFCIITAFEKKIKSRIITF